MKKTLLISGIALGLAFQPALAEDMKSKTDTNAEKAETMHAPTNRVGDQVPTMKSSENKDDASMSKDASKEKSAETMHAPTNRVGDQVPTMTSAENEKDEKSDSTTAQ